MEGVEGSASGTAEEAEDAANGEPLQGTVQGEAPLEQIDRRAEGAGGAVESRVAQGQRDKAVRKIAAASAV